MAVARSSCCGTLALRTKAPWKTRTRCTWKRSRKPASSGWLCWGRSSCLVLGAAVRLSRRSRYEARVRAAGLTGALIAFVVGAAGDWLWQVPALPAAFLLLSAALACARARVGTEARAVVAASRRDRRRDRVALCRRGPARDGQHGARKPGGGVRAAIRPGALADARAAVRLEPGAASPRDPARARARARGRCARCARVPPRRPRPTNRATGATWLIVSRLEAEAGRPDASVAAYLRSRSLNPQSPLFRQ